MKYCALLLSSVLVSTYPIGYLDNESLEKTLKDATANHGQRARLTQAAETLKKNSVWLFELGTGTVEERKRRPAMLLVAGIEGTDLAGTSSAVSWAKQLLNGSDPGGQPSKLLDSTTIYIFPRLNPDAAETFFSRPKLESARNLKPADDDHDGLVDEDGPNDLNGDGLINWMRIEDPEGEYVQDSTDPRLLIKADKSKGEKGRWRLLIEGRDDDQDEAWNEDGIGGVNLNRNFPFNYKFFTSDSGLHPVSETEARALADFVVDHPNIGIVFTFGAADNLSQLPKSEPGGRRPPTAIQDGDLPYYRELGKVFRDAVGLKKELPGASEAGTFSDWMYFHRGRLSLAARPWSSALQVELAKPAADSEKRDAKAQAETRKNDSPTEPQRSQKQDSPNSESEKKTAEKTKTESDNRNEEDRAFLKWIDANAPESFAPWKAFDHPDFPKRKVEIGGFTPFAKMNPPEKFLDELAGKHSVFLSSLADKLPRIGIRTAEAKHLGDSIYEIIIQVENTGYLPSALAQGVTSREVLPTRVTLDAAQEDILAGSKRFLLGVIEGSGGMREVRCTLRAKGKDKLGVEVISALGGTVKTTIELKPVQ